MHAVVRIRDARTGDAADVCRIGRVAMSSQYHGLVDSSAVEAAVEQTYSDAAVADCITRCLALEKAEFLVAEREGLVVGYLHFDSLGPEPELHRLYVDSTTRGAGVGALLMRELHQRLAPDQPYMLLVAEGNERAVAFYRRHGLEVDGLVDGLSYYAQRMGVTFPDSTAPFQLILMRRSPATPD